jgi:hypothetical protein
MNIYFYRVLSVKDPTEVHIIEIKRLHIQKKNLEHTRMHWTEGGGHLSLG